MLCNHCIWVHQNLYKKLEEGYDISYEGHKAYDIKKSLAAKNIRKEILHWNWKFKLIETIAITNKPKEVILELEKHEKMFG